MELASLGERARGLNYLSPGSEIPADASARPLSMPPTTEDASVGRQAPAVCAQRPSLMTPPNWEEALVGSQSSAEFLGQRD